MTYTQAVGRAPVVVTTRHGTPPKVNSESMLMGGLCHLTAVWLLYGRPYDLVARGQELFDRLELSFRAKRRIAKRSTK